MFRQESENSFRTGLQQSEAIQASEDKEAIETPFYEDEALEAVREAIQSLY